LEGAGAPATQHRRRGGLAMASYARADVLVETGWLQEHLGDPNLRIVESNEDPELYAQGHIPGAIHLRWKTDLQDPVRRDWVSRAQLEQLLGFRGIGNEHTIVLYGDKNNWFATYTFWLLSYYGVENLKILNGGRQKWVAGGRDLQARGGAAPAVRVPGGHPGQGRDRLLPDRGAQQPHVVHPEVPVGLPEGEELRRQLDRVG
jgi:3-mercaptopyruvate sulfurtransferase SseA